MSNLLSLIGWSFLPGLVTGWTQSLYYSITIRAGDPKPTPGSPRYAEHYRRIYILVVSLYLLYSIYEADWDLRRAGDFYTDLGVGLDASEKDIKSRFRRLAAVYHPDKAGTAGTGGAGDTEGYFLRLKVASETLVDPVKRFAYDRFGPDVNGWQNCKTVRDYVGVGVGAVMPYYAAAAAVLYGLPWFGYMQSGQYWRWLVFAAVLVFEMKAVTRPEHPALFTGFVNPWLEIISSGHSPYLPFQAVALARKLSLTFGIAVAQVGPFLTASTKEGKVDLSKAQNSEVQMRQGIDRLQQAATILDVDVGRMMDLELVPFAGNPEVLQNLREKMKEWLVQNTIRSDPMVKDAMGNSVRRRRVDAPAGARGTR